MPRVVMHAQKLTANVKINLLLRSTATCTANRASTHSLTNLLKSSIIWTDGGSHSNHRSFSTRSEVNSTTRSLSRPHSIPLEWDSDPVTVAAFFFFFFPPLYGGECSVSNPRSCTK